MLRNTVPGLTPRGVLLMLHKWYRRALGNPLYCMSEGLHLMSREPGEELFSLSKGR